MMNTICGKMIFTWIGVVLTSTLALGSSVERTFERSAPPPDNWYGDDVYFGLHYDMHANAGDVNFGGALTTAYLTEILQLAKPDLLQTDTKGHEGLTSWHSQTPTASVAPGIAREMVKHWVGAAQTLGLPIQGHYSGIADMAAGKKFPEWSVLNANGDRISDKMCPLGPYVDELLIPQAIELGERGISTLWVDGEIWAVAPCYCERCATRFEREYGLAPPTSQDDENWTRWIGFTRSAFEEYVAHYATEIRRHHPNMRICSNWLHTFRHPGKPWVPTDYLSGDNLGTLSHPNNATNARFMATRDRPWEIVVWGFAYNEKSPWVMKSLDMLKQQTAPILALGGIATIYNQPKGHRDGRLVEWQMRMIGELADFVNARKEYCQNNEMLPNVAILHSEYDFYSQKSPNIWEYETRHIEGALAALLDNSMPSDILDEWALLDRISDFPLVVASTQENMSAAAVSALKAYVEQGGRLLVTGTGIYDTLGSEFLGVDSRGVEPVHSYHVPGGGKRVPLSSHGHQGPAWTESNILPWRAVQPTTARGIMPVTTTLFEEDSTDLYGATINKVGEGYVAYIPCDIMTYYYNSRYSVVRDFISEVLMEMRPPLVVDVSAPVAVETVLRQKDGVKYLHFINRASGLPVFEQTRMVEEVPRVGPITVEWPLPTAPAAVELLLDDANIEWEFVESNDPQEHGLLRVQIPTVHIHSILSVK